MPGSGACGSAEGTEGAGLLPHQHQSAASVPALVREEGEEGGGGGGHVTQRNRNII